MSRTRTLGWLAFLTLGALAAVWGLMAPAESAGMRITEAGGEVYRVRDGATTAASEGTPVGPGDVVGTGPDGVAVLGQGETEVRLRGGTVVQVRGIDDRSVELELERGETVVRVRPGARAIRLTQRGRVLRSADGTFRARVDTDGVLAAQADVGRVALGGFGDLEALEEGERLYDGEDGPVVVPIPAELLADVVWPPAAPADRVTLEGTTEPLARVLVVTAGGEGSTVADDEGRFEVEVPLSVGTHDVEVRVVDRWGATTSVRGRVTRTATVNRTLPIDVQYELPR